MRPRRSSGCVDDDLQVVRGDGEAADGVGRVGGVGGGHVVLLLGGARRGVLAVRLDRRARERRAPEQERERGHEGGEAKAGGASYEERTGYPRGVIHTLWFAVVPANVNGGR